MILHVSSLSLTLAKSRNLGLIFVQADLLRAADAADAVPLGGVPSLLHRQGRNSIAILTYLLIFLLLRVI